MVINNAGSCEWVLRIGEYSIAHKIHSVILKAVKIGLLKHLLAIGMHIGGIREILEERLESVPIVIGLGWR